MVFYIFNTLYIILILVCCIARYKNTCKCNEDNKKITDIIQIIIVGIGSYYLIGVYSIFKFIGLLLISFVIRNILELIFVKGKEQKEKTGDNCDDCNPYKTTKNN